jgi:hypothetical protein
MPVFFLLSSLFLTFIRGDSAGELKKHWLVRVSAVRTIPERGHELKKHGLVLDLNLRLGRCLILDPALCAARFCRVEKGATRCCRLTKCAGRCKAGALCNQRRFSENWHVWWTCQFSCTKCTEAPCTKCTEAPNRTWKRGRGIHCCECRAPLLFSARHRWEPLSLVLQGTVRILIQLLCTLSA